MPEEIALKERTSKKDQEKKGGNPPSEFSLRKDYEREIRKLHEALLTVRRKQLDLMKNFDLFRWEFRCNSGSFMSLLPGKMVLMISSLLNCTSLFNLWRLPFLCSKYNPSVFMLVFYIMLFFVASPMFLLEYSLGQYTSFSFTNCWGFCPGMNGIGLAMLFISLMTLYYFCGIVSYTIFMAFNAFSDPLPWSLCKTGLMNIKRLCQTNMPRYDSTCDGNYKLENGFCADQNNNIIGIYSTHLSLMANQFLQTSTAQFIEFDLLYWDLPAFVYTLNYFLLFINVLVWFLSGFLLILFAKRIFPDASQILISVVAIFFGLSVIFYYSLETGFYYGLDYILTPEWRYIYQGELWKDAASQAFMIMSVGYGRAIYQGSHNRFKNDVVLDTIVYTILAAAASTFVCFLSYNYLGIISDGSGIPIEYMSRQPLIIFILIFGQASTYFSFPPFAGFTIFVLLSFIGLIEIIRLADCSLCGLLDRFPSLHNKKFLIIVVFCTIMPILQLPLALPVGYHIIESLDRFTLGTPYLCVIAIECCTIAYVYSADRISADIEAMIKGVTSIAIPWFIFQWYWKICWLIITPMLLFFSIFYHWFTFNEQNKDIASWSLYIELIFCILCVCICFLSGVKLLAYREGNILARMGKIFVPSISWGPNLPCFRESCANKGFIIDHWTYKPLEMEDLEKFYPVADDFETIPEPEIIKKTV